nr:MAG TPA: hypothetical protein [Caudoviricetes sp.]
MPAPRNSSYGLQSIIKRKKTPPCNQGVSRLSVNNK